MKAFLECAEDGEVLAHLNSIDWTLSGIWLSLRLLAAAAWVHLAFYWARDAIRFVREVLDRRPGWRAEAARAEERRS